jgi:hypothetical protein
MAKIVGMGGNKPQKASEQPTQQAKIDLGKSNPVVCEHCGYDIFVEENG